MKDGGDVDGAGVLVRQFDKLDAGDSGIRWMPFPQTGTDNWCKDLADRWSATVLNRQANHLYEPTTGGLVSGFALELRAVPVQRQL